MSSRKPPKLQCVSAVPSLYVAGKTVDFKCDVAIAITINVAITIEYCMLTAFV